MATIVLRDSPLVEITIHNESFELKIEDNRNDSGIYEFSKVDSLRIGRRVNWLVSVTSIVVGLISSAGGDLYRERDALKFNYRNTPKRISLKGSNINLAIETIEKINRRIRAAT